LSKCLDSAKVLKKDDHDNWFNLLRKEIREIFGTDIIHLATCQVVDNGKETTMLLNDVLESMEQCDDPSKVRKLICCKVFLPFTTRVL
jgi:hypothetical protein